MNLHISCYGTNQYKLLYLHVCKQEMNCKMFYLLKYLECLTAVENLKEKMWTKCYILKKYV